MASGLVMPFDQMVRRVRRRRRESFAIGCNLRTLIENVHTGERRIIQQGHNLVVNAGLNLVRDLLIGGLGANPLSYIALGTSTTAASAGQTALVAEYYRAPITQTVSSAQAITYRLYLGSTVGNGSTITEMGLFNDPTAGTMYARAVLGSSVAKTTSIAVTFEWDLTFSV